MKVKKGQVENPSLSVLNAWYEFAKTAHRQEHWDWFVIDQFLKGNHNIRGNPQDNTVTVSKQSDGIYYPINKVYSTFRAVRAFVTRHKPKATVDVDLSDPKAEAYARRSKAVLDRDNKLNNSRLLNKEWAYFGIKYGVGYREIGYDMERKCAIRWTVDPFDLLPVQKYGELQDAPAIIKTYTRTVNYLRNKYPDHAGEIHGDDKLAADEFKELSLQIQYQNTSQSPGNDDGEQTATVCEASYALFKENSLGGMINKTTFLRNVILKEEETPFDEYNFIPYKADIVPNQSAGEGHLKHIIAPQRMLNLLNTQMLEYNHIVNRGRFLIDKNSGFEVVNSKEGQIIKKNPGKQVQVLNPPAINPMLQHQLGLAVEFIEDLGGQHQASQGAAPPRVSSGDAIQALQTGDSNNITDLRDNFEDALALEAAWILKVYSMFEKKGFVMSAQVSENKIDKFAVVGKHAYDKTGTDLPEKYYHEDTGSYVEVCSILADNNVKISVISELGETAEARMNLLLKLLEAGLPMKIVLQHLEFPNTSDILERIASESAADIVKQQALNASMQNKPEPPPPPRPPAETLNYKDAPPDVQREIEAQAGLKPSQIGGSAPVEQNIPPPPSEPGSPPAPGGADDVQSTPPADDQKMQLVQELMALRDQAKGKLNG